MQNLLEQLDPSKEKTIKWKDVFQKSIKRTGAFEKKIDCYV